MKRSCKILILLTILIISCAERNPAPPVAKIIPHKTIIHSDTLIDNYHWLKDNSRTNPEVIKYIQEENEYTEKMLKHTEKLQEKLFNEIVGRIKETDLSVPTKIDDYYYYTKREKGKQYWVYCRKQGNLDTKEEMILDVNKLAKNYEYFDVGELKISPNHQYLAYSTDTTGTEIYTLHIKNLETDENLKDSISPICDITWANDNKTIFYSAEDETGRSDRIYQHILGTDMENDELIYQENDGAFWVWIDKTRSKEYLILGTSSKTTSEIRFLKADNPPANAEFKLIHPRETDMEYDVYHHQDKFYIQTNEADSKNFKIMTAPVENPCKANWKEFIPHRDSVYISAFDVFKDYVVIHERKNGLEDMRIIDLNSMKEHYVGFPEPVYVFYSGRNPNFDTKTYRFTYESLVTPYSTFDYNMKTREKELKKQQVVLGGYEPSQYESERVFAQSKDSTMIPISLVYKKDLFKKDGSNPLLLNGYGSYGDCNDPYFSTSRLSLLDRGFVYAFAHIRGGGEMGKIWYEQGRVLSKMNTFTDFIACAEYLISEKYTSPEKLVIEGRSAGGLLIGAVLNIQPDLFRVAIVEVPFVDIVNTMLDTTLTAVVTDYEEWGNPNDKEQFEYMMSYCPYQNVKAQDYPDILILAGFYDPRVNFWEPAKWVAKLRALKTDDNKLLLKTNVSGHGIASGWYDFYKEIALEYAFIFDVLGIEK